MADHDAPTPPYAGEHNTQRVSQVAVLDRRGTVCSVNDAWREWAAAGRDDTFPRPAVGSNYVAALDRAAAGAGERMAGISTGVREVMAGRRRRLVSEYLSRSADGVHWLRLNVEPHHNADGRVVVCHGELREVEKIAARLRWTSRMGGSVSAGAVLLDAERVIVYADSGAAGMHGYSSDELVGGEVDLLCAPHESVAALRPLLARIRRRGQATATIEHVRRDGSRFPAETSGYLVHDDVGHDVGILLTMQDVAERRRAEDALRDSEERFRALVQNGFDPILLLGSDGRVRYASPSIERISGINAVDILGPSAALLAAVHGEDAERVSASFAEAIERPDDHIAIEFRAHHRDGSVRHLQAILTNLLHVPSVDGLVVNLRDVTEHRQLEEALRHQAFHDPLTGLPNRLRFLERLSRAVSTPAAGGLLGVFFLDLDGFKSVNDDLGHAAGDALLLAVGRRLGSCIRPEDVVARFGGDEFAVLAEGLEQPSDAMALARRFLAALQQPVRFEGETVAVTASIGVALASGGDNSPDELLRRADVALYRAKAAGRGRAIAFHAGDTCRTVTPPNRN